MWLAAFLFLVLACRAEQLPVRRYTTSDGLAGNRIESILADSHGFLWFGTADGVSRFDGYQFTNFTSTEGLPGNSVSKIIESRSGAYWIATNHGPCRFDPRKREPGSRFTAFALQSRANTLLEDRDGAIWCGTFSGLYRLSKGQAAFEQIDIGIPHGRNDNDTIVSALLEDSQGTLWVGTGNALYRRAAGGRTLRFTERDGLPADFGFVQALVEDYQGRIWIATRHGIAVTVQRPPLDRLALAHVYGDPRHGRVSDWLWTNSLFQASDGKLWAGGGPIALFTPGNLSGGAPFHFYGAAQGLAEGGIGAFAEDRAGNLWIGTDGNGVMKIARNGFVRFGERDGLSQPLDSIFESRLGELCLVAEEGQRRILKWFDGRRFIPVRPDFPASLYFGWGASQVAFQDRTGEWWFATGQGVYRFPRTANVRGLDRLRPKAVYTVRDGLAGDNVFRIFEDSRGDVWAGSVGDVAGLARWERATGSWRKIADLTDAPTAFAEDREGNLWVGCFRGWVGRVRDGKWSVIPGFGPGLSGTVGSIHVDRTGRVWIGTNGPGLFRIDQPDRAQPSVVRYTTREGLAGNRIEAILEDRHGRIWVSTASGVESLDLSGGAIPRMQHYSTADGLAGGEGMFAFCDRSGALWFYMQRGLSRIEPEAPRTSAPPPVLVTGVRVAGAAWPVSDLGETALRLPDLRPGQNQLQIEFTGIQFAAGETLRYQFGMEGDDPEWGPLAAGRSVTYAGLRPGRYRFHVRAVNSAGRASDQAAVVTFVILPPFWQRWWFVLLLAASAVSLSYTLYRYRLSQMLELERVRTRIATDLHDDIGASLSQIAVLSEVARIDSDRGARVQEPLSRIAGISRELVDSISDIVWATSPQRDRFSELSSRMREFAEDVLVPRNIDFRLEAPEFGDLKLGPDMRRQVFLIFKECVHNIARHSNCTEASAELRIHNEELILRVSDNGLKSRTLEAGCRTNGGNGIASMKRRAKSLGGSLDLKSEAGKGFALVLHAPLDRG
ncbi:MAG TPA: two-component regulator propeller domain-containing protein [Bryobacteraceae bacterium]|nr:two-component regulator propeller domain-containing protein [Bryobacteraceae bacterium]